MVGEQELGGPAGARVRSGLPGERSRRSGRRARGCRRRGGPSARCRACPAEPSTMTRPGHLVHAVEFEVEQLADAHPGGAQQQQRVGAQPVRRGVQRLGQPPVGVEGQVPGQRPGQSGNVAREDRVCGRGVGPAPFVDVVDEAARRSAPAGAGRRPIRVAPVRGLRAAATAARYGSMWRCRSRPASEVRRGVVVGEEPGEMPKPAGDAQHGRSGAGARGAVQVGHQRIGQRCSGHRRSDAARASAGARYCAPPRLTSPSRWYSTVRVAFSAVR